MFEEARPRDLAAFGDVARDDRCDFVAFRKGDQARTRFRKLSRPAGARLQSFHVNRLDGIDDDHLRAGRLGGGEGRIEVGLGNQRDARFTDSEPSGPKAHLARRFLATNVGDGDSSFGKPGGRLQHQRGLPDAGIAAHKYERPGDNAAP